MGAADPPHVSSFPSSNSQHLIQHSRDYCSSERIRGAGHRVGYASHGVRRHDLCILGFEIGWKVGRFSRI